MHECDECGLKFPDDHVRGWIPAKDLARLELNEAKSHCRQRNDRRTPRRHIRLGLGNRGRTKEGVSKHVDIPIYTPSIMLHIAERRISELANDDEDSGDNDASKVLLGRSVGNFRQNRYWIRPLHLPQPSAGARCSRPPALQSFPPSSGCSPSPSAGRCGWQPPRGTPVQS